MDNEVHVVPMGLNSWAVNVGHTSYQGFDSEEKALAFSRKLAEKNSEYKILFHSRDGKIQPVNQSQQTRH